MSVRLTFTLLVLSLSVALPSAAPRPRSSALPDVDVRRLPDGGLQPEVLVDATGVLHLVYLAGLPASADVFYTRSDDGGRTFSPRVRVNSQAGSAIATGTIRGAQLALGRHGRVHVVWNGSATAAPKPPTRAGQAPGMPLLYARSAPGGGAFEPQRTVMTATRHLDGGGSVAADDAGHVLVAWHGNALDGPEGETSRRVWLARSADDGHTFAPETAISPMDVGACGCCGLRLAAAGDQVHVMFRAATRMVHRDVYLLRSPDGGRSFSSTRLDEWEIGACPMSSMAIAAGPEATYAWEHDGNVAFGREQGAPTGPSPVDPKDVRGRRKHPRLAIDPQGVTVLAWATGTGWNTGGAVGWQMFVNGAPAGAMQAPPDLPAWSFPAVAAVRGRFVLLY